MSININKKIITGVLYSYNELGGDLVDDYFMKNPKKFEPCELIQLDPYNTGGLPDYILGIIEHKYPEDGNKAPEDTHESLQVMKPNKKNIETVEKIIGENNLPKKIPNRYGILYFS